MKAFRQNHLVQAWLVLVLALVFGLALTAIEASLNPIIQANKTRETMASIPSLVPDTFQETGQKDGPLENLRITPRKIVVKKNRTSKYYTVYDVTTAGGLIAGYVVKATGKGYADTIDLLVGFDSDVKTITGLFVLDQKETPGLGNKILESSWRSQFAGKPTDGPLVVVKTEQAGRYEIDGISGATISSRSVTQTVNAVVSDIRETLVSQGKTKKENHIKELGS